MNWDTEDLLHSGKGLGHFFRASVSSMLRNNDRLVDIYKENMGLCLLRVI